MFKSMTKNFTGNLIGLIYFIVGCDNFYFFPIRMLDSFKELCDFWKWRRYHDLKHKFEERWGIDSVHYILNEHTWVNNLSFYKIVRTYI